MAQLEDNIPPSIAPPKKSNLANVLPIIKSLKLEDRLIGLVVIIIFLICSGVFFLYLKGYQNIIFFGCFVILIIFLIVILHILNKFFK